jgi:prepilin-type N-terminal cleavage/methylation domain-containing protein
MITKIMKKQQGFTLVEVIVVAVIVAVLAAVAIPLYMSYVSDSATNTANNQAAAAATFLSAARSGCQDYAAPANLVAGGQWAYTSNNAAAGAKDVVYTCPTGAILTIAGSTVTCTIKGKVSGAISF